MRLRRLALLAPLTIWVTTALLLAYSRGPLPKHTGGFGEETCATCHKTFGLNAGRPLGGDFRIDGVPKSYVAGGTYPITVTIQQPGQSRWGFQLSARSSDSGQQAGRLVPVDDTTQVLEPSGVQYIEHTLVGTRKGTVDGPVEFHFNWIAPVASAPVLFNAAGNAANSDDNPTGDYIYTAGSYSKAPGATTITRVPAGRMTTESKWGERLNESSKLVNLPVPKDLNKGQVEIQIQHRFAEALADSRPGRAFGIDSGANINLATNYAVTNRLSMGVSRARTDQVIAFTGTYELQTRKESFWKMSLVGGVTGQRNFERQFSPYLQLTSSLEYKGVRFYSVPTAVFYTRPRELVEFFPSLAVNRDDSHTFSMGFGADVALDRRFSLVVEYVPRLAGFGGFREHRGSFGGGVEIRTWGHVFSILLGTSRDFTPGKYAVNPGERDVSLGFNIYRRIR